mgnify:CR=1 FL=1
MLELTMALALEVQRPMPVDRSDCRPRPHLLRSAPPPPAFSVERIASPGRERMSLAAYRCPDRVNWRVMRHAGEAGQGDYVLGAACPEAVRWIEAVARLPLPNPVLASFGETPRGATWFVLRAHHVTGGGYRRDMELTLIERDGPSQEPIALWAREGEAVFQRCHAEQAERVE